MPFVETDIQDQIMIIKLNRPERLNALSKVIREGMADAFNKFKNDKDLEVAILTGEGRGFCAGEDMKESLEVGKLASAPMKGDNLYNPFINGYLEKPVIGAKRALILFKFMRITNWVEKPIREIIKVKVIPTRRTFV